MKKEKSNILPIIILNWNGFKDTHECINSVLKEKPKNICIHLIDNGSKKEDVLNIAKYFGKNPLIKITFHSKNLGFTKAHNLIFKEIIRENYSNVFLLNNDTIASSKGIEFLNDQFQEVEADVMSCKMIKLHDQSFMDSAGHKMLSNGEILPIGHNRRIENYDSVFENMGASAGAALYSTAMLKDIGIFDEYFETGYEDAEFGLRAYIAGYHCQFEPKAIFYHKIGQSLKKVFNYDYALKTQLNVFYTYIKLVHWQILLINSIPWILRLLFITFIGIIALRFKYLKILFKALKIFLFKDLNKALKARKASKKWRRISWWKLFLKQEFFLINDIRRFVRYIIKGEKSYFENY